MCFATKVAVAVIIAMATNSNLYSKKNQIRIYWQGPNYYFGEMRESMNLSGFDFNFNFRKVEC